MGVRTDRVGELRRGFDTAAAALGSVLDVEQRPVADRLAVLGASLQARPPRLRRRGPGRGVYVHGPVGRGKTWLVDVLLAQLDPGPVLRLHTFPAARLLHRQLARHAGRGHAVDLAVGAVLDGVRLLFLDELHAHDPGDAMILSRLVRALPEHRCVLVATCNYAPGGLLPDPRHHHLVLPLVQALEQRCDVLELAGPVDHRALGHGRARPGWGSGAWLCPGSASQLAGLGLAVPEVRDRVRLRVGGRALWALHEQERVVQFSFAELCEGRVSVGDLLELADRYRTVVLDGVPALSTASPDAGRRFADLVDVSWDRDVRLVVLARHEPAGTLDTASTDQARTASRLLLLGGG